MAYYFHDNTRRPLDASFEVDLCNEWAFVHACGEIHRNEETGWVTRITLLTLSLPGLGLEIPFDKKDATRDFYHADDEICEGLLAEACEKILRSEAWEVSPVKADPCGFRW